MGTWLYQALCQFLPEWRGFSFPGWSHGTQVAQVIRMKPYPWSQYPGQPDLSIHLRAQGHSGTQGIQGQAHQAHQASDPWQVRNQWAQWAWSPQSRFHLHDPSSLPESLWAKWMALEILVRRFDFFVIFVCCASALQKIGKATDDNELVVVHMETLSLVWTSLGSNVSLYLALLPAKHQRSQNIASKSWLLHHKITPAKSCHWIMRIHSCNGLRGWTNRLCSMWLILQQFGKSHHPWIAFQAVAWSEAIPDDYPLSLLRHSRNSEIFVIHGGSIFFWRRSLKAWRHDDLCALIGIILIVLVLQKHCRYITEKQGWHNFACFCSFFRHQWTLVPACRLSWRRFPNLRACHLLCYKVESTCTAICACFSCSCCHTSKSRS